MSRTNYIGKREFIQHTSRYIKMAEQEELIITHQGKPCLKLISLKSNSLRDLKKLVNAKVIGDINEHVLSGYDQW